MRSLKRSSIFKPFAQGLAWFSCIAALLGACNWPGAPPAAQSIPTVAPAIKTAVAQTFSKSLINHFILIVMENTSMSQVEQAPYFQTLMDQYAYTKNYYAVAHPSLPNYLALIGGDTFGITVDCLPSSPKCQIPGKGNNLADQLEEAGLSWKAYLEAMPAPCSTTDQNVYYVRHNPFVYFDEIRNDPQRCAAHDLPFSQFETDLKNNDLPNYAWISPDSCHDMHDQCEQDKTRIQQGEEWLQKWVPEILASDQFGKDGMLIITFDEANDSDTRGCCGQPGGGRVLTLVISPVTGVKSRGWSSSNLLNHYSLLRMVEDIWGLKHLNRASDDAILPAWDFFMKNK
jgi:phosphatidylinositol-3-phosphatase